MSTTLYPEVLNPAILFSGSVELGGGASTSVDVLKHSIEEYIPEIVVFDEEVELLSWCRANGIKNAINGGFTMYHRDSRPTELLGRYVMDGRQMPAVPFAYPKSILALGGDENLSVIHRDDLPEYIDGDHFEAGPMLIKDGENLTDRSGFDYENVGDLPLQMDTDWTGCRAPRSAIGIHEDGSVVTVTCNGYPHPHEEDADQGMTIKELANFMAGLSMKSLLNLDGGSKSTHIHNGKLINKPRGGEKDEYRYFEIGLPVLSAVIFRPKI